MPKTSPKTNDVTNLDALPGIGSGAGASLDTILASLDTGLASAGGGGGAGAAWEPGDIAPLEDTEFDIKIWKFTAADAGVQKLLLELKVPEGYGAGDQLQLLLGLYSPSAANTILLQCTTTLIRKATDAVDSVTNQHASANTALTNTVAKQSRVATLPLMDGAGEINSIAVSAGDLLKIELVRGTDTDVADIRFMKNATEVGTA